MKNLFYLFLAVTMFACSGGGDDDNSPSTPASIEGTYVGTFEIPVGPYTPNGDSGSFTVTTTGSFDDFYPLEGTITSSVFGSSEVNGGYIELDESNELIFSISVLSLGNEWPNVEVYGFDGVIVNGQITNGVVTTAHTQDGTFTGFRQ